MYRLTVCLLGLLAVSALLAACDSGIAGDPNVNEPPETELAVQAADLRDVLTDTLAVPGDTLIMGGDTTVVDEVITDTRRFTSLVEVNWAGTDPDGFVEAFELRFYDETEAGTIGPEAGWSRTTRRDSLVLLPIPSGSPIANVVFEVRAVDNDGAVDPTPAQTVFPVRNTPPTLQVSRAEAPADTTWPAASFAFTASDIDGETNLAAIEVALNDTTDGFVRLPAETDFLTLVAEDPQAAETDARLLLGRGGVPSDLSLPGFRTDAQNTIYLRAVDAADFRSETVAYPDPDPEAGETWYVKRVTSPILLVNDYRSTSNDIVLSYHRELLDTYAGAGNYDEWYLAEPFQTGTSTTVAEYSENLPTNPDPTLRPILEFWDHIYWVSSNATNSSVGNNLPLVANFLDDFFEGDGSLFVNVVVNLPANPEDNLGNAALAVLPLAELLSFGEGTNYPEYQQQLDLFSGAAITPVEPLPNGETLPALRVRSGRFIGGTFGYPVGSGAIPLYQAEYMARNLEGDYVEWPGPSTVASIRTDGQVALFALPFLTTVTGTPLLEGADGDPDAPQEAIRLILAALDFPR